MKAIHQKLYFQAWEKRRKKRGGKLYYSTGKSVKYMEFIVYLNK